MQKITTIALAVLLLPAFATAQTYPTNRNRNNGVGISGDINGDLSGTSTQKKRYYYKRDLQNRPGCLRNKAGHYICK